ncbi:MAG: hypothetical protein FRX49_03164 [Trebouxia sp. A1-2]|nr:MAG: hypothetical protein FRX49_03164 [Trebouxia sp. A1-2]
MPLQAARVLDMNGRSHRCSEQTALHGSMHARGQMRMGGGGSVSDVFPALSLLVTAVQLPPDILELLRCLKAAVGFFTQGLLQGFVCWRPLQRQPRESSNTTAAYHEPIVDTKADCRYLKKTLFDPVDPQGSHPVASRKVYANTLKEWNSPVDDLAVPRFELKDFCGMVHSGDPCKLKAGRASYRVYSILPAV